MSDGLEGIPQDWLQPHPVLPLPARQQVAAWLAMGEPGRAHLEKALRDRAELIQREREDPIHYGYQPEPFLEVREQLLTHDEVFMSGQNRGGKTRCAAGLVVEDLYNNPNKHWLCFDTSEKTSIDKQQKAIFEMFPPAWKRLAKREGNAKKKGDVYLSYNTAGGFTNFKAVFPNKSQISFGNYKQDVTIYEGYEIDGVWFDENAPLAFIDAMAFRIGRGRRMILLFTYTPVAGGAPVFTAAVQRFLAGATILKTRRASLLPENMVHVKGCPPGHMPYVMQCRNPKAAVVFFHWGTNPYGANDEVRGKIENQPLPIVRVRAYGWVDKLVQSAFPKFNKDAHVITRKRFNEIVEKHGGTRYVSADPRPGRNWFIKWYLVTPQGWVIVYREWPDLPRYGEWALTPSDDGRAVRVDWRPGPAQRTEAGRGLAAYKALLLETEGWEYDGAKEEWVKTPKTEIVHRRLMDPRFGGSEVPSQEEGETIIEMMAADDTRDPLGRKMPAMDWEQAPASSVHGAGSALEMVNNLMDYRDSEPITPLNCPRWFAVEDCHHSILAYQEFTNAGSEKDALKDPVDCDRYFAKAECGYVAPQAMKVKRGGYW